MSAQNIKDMNSRGIIFCEFLTQHRRVMLERENKYSSSSKRKEELVTTFSDKQKIFMGLWHSGQLHWFCIPAFIVGSNPTSSRVV